MVTNGHRVVQGQADIDPVDAKTVEDGIRYLFDHFTGIALCRRAVVGADGYMMLPTSPEDIAAARNEAAEATIAKLREMTQSARSGRNPRALPLRAI